MYSFVEIFVMNKIKIYLNDLSTLQVVVRSEIAIIAHIFIEGSNSVSFKTVMKSILSGTSFYFHMLNHIKPSSTILTTNSP